jgi:hypothetical protein
MKKWLYSICLLSAASVVHGMTFDNRFFPLYLKPYMHRVDTLSHVRAQPLFMHAERSFGDLDDIGLPEIGGKYDQVEIARALRKTGCVQGDPFRSDLRGLTSIPWRRDGVLDSEGLALSYEQALNCNFSLGGSLLFMHINARHQFFIDPSCTITFAQGDREYLDLLKQQFHGLLGVTPPLFKHTYFGDVDFYGRFNLAWDYTLKMRRIDFGLFLGGIAPTGGRRFLDNPASIAIGGDKHWGMYGGFDSDIELREDWHFGLMARVIKRFAKSQLYRMPVLQEPEQYGAVVGRFRVDPGVTIVVAPFARLEGMRDGFGVQAGYTLVNHFRDKIVDERQNKTVTVNIPAVEARSSWGLEHVTVQAFYDFGKCRDTDSTGYYPVVSAAWDIPTHWIVSKRAYNTNSVSLMVEVDF